MVNAVSFATVALAYAPAERPRVLALLSLAWLLPSFLGPLLGGLVAEAFGWRWVFLGLAVLMPAVRAAGGAPGPRAAARSAARTRRPARADALRSMLPPAGQVRVAALVGPARLDGHPRRGQLRAARALGHPGSVEHWRRASRSRCCRSRGRSPRSCRAGSRAGAHGAGRRGWAWCCCSLGLPFVALDRGPGGALPVTWVGWAVCGLGAGFTFQASNLHVMAAARSGRRGPRHRRRRSSRARPATAWERGSGGVVLSAALGAGLALSGALGLVFAICLAAGVAALLRRHAAGAPGRGPHARARSRSRAARISPPAQSGADPCAFGAAVRGRRRIRPPRSAAMKEPEGA